MLCVRSKEIEVTKGARYSALIVDIFMPDSALCARTALESINPHVYPEVSGPGVDLENNRSLRAYAIFVRILGQCYVVHENI